MKYKTWRISKLREVLENHNCNLSSEEGCMCTDIRQELLKRENNIYTKIDVSPYGFYN